MFGFVCAGIFSTLQMLAQVKLPAVIADNMVLQQKTKVALWGWAKPGEAVTVKPGWTTTSIKTTADKDGKWLLYVKTTKAGGPYNIVFEGSDRVEVKNVLLGEVWLSSGQSNMEFFMEKVEKSGSYTGEIHAATEIPLANYPTIRMIDIENKVAAEPQKDTKGIWMICSPETVGKYSAVAYYFARRIQKETGFPVGIINSTWGGTPAESWTRKDVLESDTVLSPILRRYEKEVADYPQASEAYKLANAKWKADSTTPKPAAPKEPIGPNSNKSPYKLYNGMIAPIVPYTFKGVIWYQGENNAERAYQYRTLFPAMIQNWRTDFNNAKLPFYFVQISPHRSQNPEIRDAQLYVYRHVANTGIAITSDNGDEKDIHPRNKLLVAERLALWPLHDLYGQKKIVYSSPLYKSMKVDGTKIRIRFDMFGSTGLVAKDGDLKEFTIAGSDGQFVPARASIEGNTIVVWSDDIKYPTAVRFAWNYVPKANLFNQEGLPVSPFRTDNWTVVTQYKR